MATQRYLRYQLAHPEANVETIHYIDLAKDLSLVNQRLYRSGKDYYIASAKIASSNTGVGYVEMNTIPCTSRLKAAWKKARSLWNRMNNLSLKNAGLTRKALPRWHDFKVPMSANISTLTPVDGGKTPYPVGSGEEWQYSQFVSPTQTDDSDVVDEFNCHMLGGHVIAGTNMQSASIAHGFEETQLQSTTIGEPLLHPQFDTSWMSNLLERGETSDDILTNIDQHNDVAPYHPTDIVGGSTMPEPHTVNMGVISNENPITTFGGCCVPFGLLQFRTMSDTAADQFTLIITLKEGKYKGIKALEV